MLTLEKDATDLGEIQRSKHREDRDGRQGSITMAGLCSETLNACARVCMGMVLSGATAYEGGALQSVWNPVFRCKYIQDN